MFDPPGLATERHAPLLTLRLLRLCAPPPTATNHPCHAPGASPPSLRDAVYYLAEFGRDGASWDTFQGADRLHPNDLGHKVMADLVVYLLQQSAIGLATHPPTSADMETAVRPLPPPMYPGETCGCNGVPCGCCVRGMLCAVTADPKGSHQ
jgi:hypothetical protein